MISTDQLRYIDTMKTEHCEIKIYAYDNLDQESYEEKVRNYLRLLYCPKPKSKGDGNGEIWQLWMGDVDDFSCIRDVEFPKEIIVNFVKSILELNEDDEVVKEVKHNG